MEIAPCSSELLEEVVHGVHPDNALQSVNALVQHQNSDDAQDGCHQRGVVSLHPVLEPGQQTVELLTGHGVGQYRDRDRRRGDAATRT
jgi:methionine aminopeptidase